MNSLNLEDALIPTAQHPIKLAAFEGPLDLLLFLIRKNEIDIYDIPIEKVTQQYLDFLYASKIQDLELSGEFFVMAATLMLIKSRMLLPKIEQTQEEELEEDNESDPRWELVQQLLNYKKIKEEAQKLEALIEKNYNLLPRIVNIDDSELAQRPLKNSSNVDIWNAFNKVLKRLADRLYVGEIQEEYHTVADRMSFVMDKLKGESEFFFSQLFVEKTSVGILVNTFLAILELTRLKFLYLQQSENFDDILCLKRDSIPQELDLDSDSLL